MTFKDINNNDLLINRISRSIKNGNISHAYIFECGASSDKEILADSFAKAILCREQNGVGCDGCIICAKITNSNYEDIIYVEKDGASIKDEDIEELQEKLKKKPYGGERNIGIIKDADTMTQRAQNRLLKTLEEPFLGTVLILLTTNFEKLNKTILSRCVIMKWNSFVSEDFGDLMDAAEGLVSMLLNREPFYLNKSKLMNLSENRDDAYKLLDFMQISYGKRMREHSCSKEAAHFAIRCIEEARNNLMHGMNVMYTLKNMILKIQLEVQW
jgi:DNA polymerase-3 subunit delta'